jgi:hypothetical protein
VDHDNILIGNISLVFHDSLSPTPSEMTREERYLKLVTILPSEQKYEETVTIRAELEAQEESDFGKSDMITDVAVSARFFCELD